MAEWTYAPQFDSSWEESAPPTLVTVLSDGKTIRRQKHTNAPQTWTEEYWFTKAQHDTAKTFFETKYLLTSFTKFSWDVGATPSTERSVYFASPWNVTRTGDDWFTVVLTFERAY